MGLSQQEYWSGLSCPRPGDLPIQGIELGTPALAGRLFIAELPGKPPIYFIHSIVPVSEVASIVSDSLWPRWLAAHQASLVQRLPQARTLEWVATCPSGIRSINSENRSILVSQFIPSLFPPWYQYICSLCLCLFFCFVNKVVHVNFFKVHIHALIYRICLSDLLHSVRCLLGPCTSPQMTQFSPFQDCLLC